MVKECKSGYHWCPIKKECVPTEDKKQGKGLGRGEGNGPIGIPKKKIVEGLNKLLEDRSAEISKHNQLADKEKSQFKNRLSAFSKDQARYAIDTINKKPPTITRDKTLIGKNDKQALNTTNQRAALARKLEPTNKKLHEPRSFLNQKMKIKEGLNHVFENTAKEVQKKLSKDNAEWRDNKSKLTDNSNSSKTRADDFRSWKTNLLKPYPTKG